MAYNIVVGRNKADKEKFGEHGTINLGKLFVTMGQTTSLSNNIMMDVARTHVVLIAGKRGSGKCVVGDTLITLADGTVCPIKELEQRNEKIMGLNDQLKVVPLKKDEFFKRKVNRVLKVKLRSGKEITLTPEHPLLTIKGWKPVEELTIGSRIGTPRKIDNFGKGKMDIHKLKLLAYLIAEGHTKGHYVLFSNEDKTILEEFEETVKQFDEDLKIDLHGKSSSYRISRKDNPHGKKNNYVKDWLIDLKIQGKLAPKKFIPPGILQLEKDFLRVFLDRLFSCDGSIYYNSNRSGWEIDYSSSSKILIHQVHHLLLRFGILSRIRTKNIKLDGKKFVSYEIIIGSDNITKYIKEIGFFHPEKKKKSQQCLKEIENIVRNPNVDTIPKELWETYRPKNWAEVGRVAGYAHPKAMREKIKYAPSRQTLLQVAKADQNNSITLLAQSDIFWDEITSLEAIEKETEVYDISVPKFHNFVANDILIHNSYSASVIAEEIAELPDDVKQNITVLFFDTLGVFWTMKYPNTRQEDLVTKWGLKTKAFDINIFTPEGHYAEQKEKGIPVDKAFALKTSELSAGEWCNVFEVRPTEPVGILIERVIGILQDTKKEYSIKDIIKLIIANKKTTREVKDATENKFLAADKWGLFDKHGTSIQELMQPGSVNVLDISVYTNVSGNWSIKGLVIGMISRKLLEERIKARKVEELQDIGKRKSYFFEEKIKEKPLVWIMLDECHEFLPKTGKTPATDALVQLLREGRQPGISLCLVTQQPGEIHHDVLTQSDIVLSHKLTSKRDIEALNSMMQSYLVTELQTYLNNLPKRKGSAILLDDNSERIYPLMVRPKKSWHGGEAPSALKYKKELKLNF